MKIAIAVLLAGVMMAAQDRPDLTKVVNRLRRENKELKAKVESLEHDVNCLKFIGNGITSTGCTDTNILIRGIVNWSPGMTTMATSTMGTMSTGSLLSFGGNITAIESLPVPETPQPPPPQTLWERTRFYVRHNLSLIMWSFLGGGFVFVLYSILFTTPKADQ